MITETLMRPGSGTVPLISDTPISISRDLYDLVVGVGCHVVVTPVPVDIDSMSDAQILASAIYAGRVVARPSRLQLDLLGIASWLDSYIDSQISRTTGTPTQWLGDLLINGLSTGTVSGGSNVTRTFPANVKTRREALDEVASAGGWEYEMRPDFTVDAGTSVFVSTPTVVITDRAEGPEGSYIGLLGGLLDQHVDTLPLATKVVAVGQGSGAGAAVGTASQTIALKTRSGGTPTLVNVVSAPNVPDSDIDAVAVTIRDASATARTAAVVSTGRTSNDAGGADVPSWSPPSPSYVSNDQIPPTVTTVSSTHGLTSHSDLLDYNVRVNQEAATSTARAQLALHRSSAGGGPSTVSQFVRRYLRPGDNVYVHDITSGLLDTANEIVYRGETINPALLRALSMTWPLERGLGVYVRSNAATPTYIDLTPYVAWEPPGAIIDVGDRAPASYSPAARSQPLLESRVTGDAGKWNNLSLGSANWTTVRTPQWRYNGDKVELRGTITKTVAGFAGGSTLFTLGGSNAPAGSQTVIAGPLIYDSTVSGTWVVDDGAGTFRTSSGSPTVPVGGNVHFDHLAWPI